MQGGGGLPAVPGRLAEGELILDGVLGRWGSRGLKIDTSTVEGAQQRQRRGGDFAELGEHCARDLLQGSSETATEL
jgi:hypothetical protein